MAKYGIGARVADFEGDIAEVIGKRKGFREVRYSGGKLDGLVVELSKSSLVPANDQEAVAEGDKVSAGQGVSENACGWVPKVGDRVRYSGKSKRYSDPWMIGTEGTVKSLEFGTVLVKWDVERIGGLSTGGGKYAENLEPVVAPATTTVTDKLTIEAGKFCRTRDGRKALVKYNGTDGLYPFAHDNGCGGFHGISRDGKSCINRDGADLVAEWVEPEPEVAVAEATATAEPKFSIGQKVRCIDDRGGSKFSVGEFYTVRRLVGRLVYVDENSQGMFSHRFEPAAPLAKFKVGDKVDLYRDGELVEPWRNMTITEDARDGMFEFNTDVGMLCNSRELRLSPTIPIGSTVTFTATGRLSAINENGHYQVTFPGLPAAQNSFALPAAYVSLAN